MSNDFYNHNDGVPATLTRGASTTIRSEFDLVDQGFAKLPNLAQMWGHSSNYGIAGGSADAWTATVAASYLSAYADGMQVRLKFPNANTSTTPTLNVNGLGTKTIVSESGSALQAGDIKAGGIMSLTYNVSTDTFQVTLGNFTSASAASAAAAAASQAAAAGSASTAAASATTSVSSAAAATAASNSAIAASATMGVYPNAASSNVPRGLTQASVGAITAGAGGTNGTFALGFSAGTGWLYYPSGTFTVAGGVVTAVTITGPGLCISATPVVPTVSFAASSGLTGAAVALTAQFLVTAGQGYWVQSADGKTLIRYNNVAGVATLDSTVGPIPTTALFGSDSTISNAIEVGQDSSGVRSWEVDSSGRFAVRDVLLGNARSVADLATTVDTNTSAIASAYGEYSAFIDKLRADAISTSFVAQSNVFSHAADGAPNYRLPVPVRLDANNWLVFANAQTSTLDTSQTSLVCRKLTLAADGTPTLGAVITIAAGGPDDGTGHAFQYNNACALKTASGKIIVWYTYRNDQALLHKPYMRVCPAGLDPTVIGNWTAQQDMSATFPLLAVVYPYIGGTAWWDALIFGPGKGIQLRFGAHAGRIVLPYWRSGENEASGNDLHAGFLYSDDDGVTWTLGAESWLSRANESAVAEDWHGDVLLLVRREAVPGKWVHRSRDGGASIYNTYQLDQTVLNAPVCESGFTQAANIFDFSPPKIVLTGPRPTTAASGTTGSGRDHPTIFCSYDGGRTFPYRYQLNTGVCGYSTVDTFGENAFVVFWEADASLLTLAVQVISMKHILTGV